jgi:hypothetical protein
MTTPSFDEFESEVNEFVQAFIKVLEERKPTHPSFAAAERVMIRLAKTILKTDNDALAHEWIHEWIAENMQRTVNRRQQLHP